ncbi:MAG: hypothetical protein IT236_09475 [Bacteroidia bacterium]|nr:hypothetical protein [Bacteroidia bacterium]
MKLQKISSRLAMIMAVGALTLGSCSKKKETITDPVDTDTEQSTATDNSISEGIVNDLEAMGSEASENSALTTFKSSGSDGVSMAPCATVSIVGKVITVDFGTTGCLGTDGKTRTGKLIYNYSASTPTTALFYRNPGFSMNVTSQNYVVDGYTVNINNKTITNTTPANIPSTVNPGTNLTWSISANISIIKPNSGGTISWTCNRTKELTNTNDSTCYRGQNKAIIWSRAIVKLNGSASGTNVKGETYSSVATNLIRSFQCAPDALRPHRHPFIGGTINYTPANRHARLIDYGNGTDCDFNATITINGVTYNVVL